MTVHIEPEPLRWVRRLKLRHLELFLVLNEAGSFAGAAVRLHMTASGISHWLSELEAATGARLVERGRQFRLTAQGEALRKLALRVVGDIGNTQAELAAIAEGAEAPLRVATSTAGLTYLLPTAIHLFQQEHPRVVIELHEGRFLQVVQDLENRKLDLLIRTIDARAYSPSLQHEVLFEDTIVPVVRARHPLANVGIESVTWSDLALLPWIAPPAGTRMRSSLDAILLTQTGVVITPRVVTPSLPAIQSLLQQGDYVSVCSRIVAEAWHVDGQVVAIPLKAPFGPVGAIFKAAEQHPRMHDFLQILRTVANDPRPGVAVCPPPRACPGARPCQVSE